MISFACIEKKKNEGYKNIPSIEKKKKLLHDCCDCCCTKQEDQHILSKPCNDNAYWQIQVQELMYHGWNRNDEYQEDSIKQTFYPWLMWCMTMQRNTNHVIKECIKKPYEK